MGRPDSHAHLLPVLPPDAVVHRPRQDQARPGQGAVMKRLSVLAGIALLTVGGLALAESGARLMNAPEGSKFEREASLQRGARTFANYCLNCHGAQFMRYNRLRDISLTEAQIKDNLLFAGDKVGDTMKTALSPKDGKAWFGVAPPDLSVVARSRGSDWLY